MVRSVVIASKRLQDNKLVPAAGAKHRSSRLGSHRPEGPVFEEVADAVPVEVAVGGTGRPGNSVLLPPAVEDAIGGGRGVGAVVEAKGDDVVAAAGQLHLDLVGLGLVAHVDAGAGDSEIGGIGFDHPTVGDLHKGAESSRGGGVGQSEPLVADEDGTAQASLAAEEDPSVIRIYWV